MQSIARLSILAKKWEDVKQGALGLSPIGVHQRFVGKRSFFTLLVSSIFSEVRVVDGT